jgi:two-component system, response regulator
MNRRRNTILLIEDDADDAEMILYSLTKLNLFEFVHIDDGPRALQYLFQDANEEPALILLDLKMPKVDGIEILTRLKADSTKKHIPVLVLISCKEGRRYVESFRLRPDGYLTKPVECHSFLTVLSEIGIAKLAPDISPKFEAF